MSCVLAQASVGAPQHPLNTPAFQQQLQQAQASSSPWALPDHPCMARKGCLLSLYWAAISPKKV